MSSPSPLLLRKSWVIQPLGFTKGLSRPALAGYLLSSAQQVTSPWRLVTCHRTAHLAQRDPNAALPCLEQAMQPAENTI